MERTGVNQDKPADSDETMRPSDRNVPGSGAPGAGGAPGTGDPAGSSAASASAGPARFAHGGDGAVIEELEQRLAEAQAKANEHYDAMLRAVAEAENVRRRAKEDVARAQKFGIEAFAESLLPVRDSLELALAAETPSVENMKEGVAATLQQLAGAFEKNRLVQIDPRGDRFDPNLHQAISTVPASAVQPPVPAGHVAQVLQKGYLIADRVLRPALVTVVQD